MKFSVGGGSDLMHGTGWRALKSRAGSIVLEQGVHESDLLHYFMGDVETVFAQTGILARIRTMAGISPNLAPFYQHRVEDRYEPGSQVEIDQEDSAFGVIKFTSGAAGQFTITNASHGFSAGINTVHGTIGTIELPPSRSGTPPRVMIEGRENPLSGDEMLALVLDWKLDDETASFWDGQHRMAAHGMPFEHSDRKVVAVELKALSDCIDGVASPEVGPEVGINGLALPYAMLESGFSGEVVNMTDVITGKTNANQSEIDREITM